MEEFPELELINMWTTQDARSGKSDGQWLNVLAKKSDIER